MIQQIGMTTETSNQIRSDREVPANNRSFLFVFLHSPIRRGGSTTTTRGTGQTERLQTLLCATIEYHHGATDQ
jgi:hypothetical protein